MLAEEPNLRNMMAANAIKDIRMSFTAMKMLMGLREQYDVLLPFPKFTIDSKRIFGETPGKWFASFQLSKKYNAGTLNLDKVSKGSICHF